MSRKLAKIVVPIHAVWGEYATSKSCGHTVRYAVLARCSVVLGYTLEISLYVRFQPDICEASARERVGWRSFKENAMCRGARRDTDDVTSHEVHCHIWLP